MLRYGFTLCRPALTVTNFVAAIYTDVSGKPGVLAHALSNPSSGFATNGQKNFTAMSGATLSASTKYWLVLMNDNATNGQHINVNVTSSAEDSNSLAGWSIANERHQRASKTGTWTSSENELQIKISGYANADPTDATLSALTLSGVTLTPAFAPATENYTAMVENSVTQTTVRATKSDDGATVAIAGDTDTSTPNTATVDLLEGANTITVTVVAEDGTPKTYTVVVTRADATAPSLESASVQSTGDTVTVTLDEVLHLETDILPAAAVGAFTLTADGIDLGIHIISPLGLGQNLSISLISGTTIYAGQTVKLNYDKTAAGADALEDAAGNEVDSFTDFPVTNNSELDNTAPKPESASVQSTGDLVTVTLDEVLHLETDILPAAVVGAFTLTADGIDLGIQIISPLGLGQNLSISLTSGTTIYAGQTVKLSYDKTAAGADALKDAAGNEVVSFTDFPVTNNSQIVPDTPGPDPESAVVDSGGNAVTLTFDEALDSAVATLPAAVVDAFTLTADGVALGIQSAVINGATTLTINLPSGTTIYAGQTVKLSYDKTAAGADALEDADGNEAASFTDFRVANNSEIVPDTTPPSPESAAVPSAGDRVTLIFDEALDSAVQILPAAVIGAFTLTADGVALGIQRAVINGTTTLTINFPSGTEIYAGQTVKLSYDKTEAGVEALEDADGNEAASFTDFRVANNSEIVPDTTPPSPESAAVRVPATGSR